MRIAREGSAAPPPAEPSVTPSPPTPAAEPRTSDFARLFQRLGRAVDAGEALSRRAAGGQMGDLDPTALIALQAGIYRYSEAVDLLSKLVDRTTNGVRTVLSGNH